LNPQEVLQKKKENNERALAQEAKEFLRHKLIGQRVRCSLDYSRKVANDEKPKSYYSVYLGKSNIAVEMVDNGFATVLQHRGIEDRSRDYEMLIIAENKATKGNKGVHSSQLRNYLTVDLSLSEHQNLAKSKYLPSFVRAGKIRGIVEYVFSSTKFKVLIPKDGVLLLFVLGAVRGPERGENNIYESGVSHVKNLVLQRDVDVEISDQDKKGNFIGTMWIKVNGVQTNITTSLLEQGLAKIYFPALDHSAHATEYMDAEEVAKRNRRNLWVGYDEKAEMEKRRKRQEEKREELKPKVGNQVNYDVIVTEIVNAGKFYFQVVGPDAEKLEELMKNLNSDQNLGGAYVPKKDEIVCAKFSEDGLWYRAQIISIGKKSDKASYTVFYVDYGNSETVQAENIRKIDEKYSKLTPQARQARLAFIIPPTGEEDFAEEAAFAFKDMVWNKTMLATNYTQDHDVISIQLADVSSKLLVNEALLLQGYARLEKSRDKSIKPLLEKLGEAQDTAKKQHLGIWEYGDVGSDEEDKKPRGGSGPPKKGPEPKQPAKKKE